MLKITLELAPYGDETKKQNLGVMKIGQILSEGGIADYIVILNDEEVGNVKGFQRANGAWNLVRKAIEVLPAKLRRGLHPEPSLEELAAFHEAVVKGLEDLDSGRTVSNEQVREDIKDMGYEVD